MCDPKKRKFMKFAKQKKKKSTKTHDANSNKNTNNRCGRRVYYARTRTVFWRCTLNDPDRYFGLWFFFILYFYSIYDRVACNKRRSPGTCVTHYEFTVNTYYTRFGETKARSCNGRKLKVYVQNNRFSTVVLARFRRESTSSSIWISPIFFWNSHWKPRVAQSPPELFVFV